ncbi:MAG: SUMF1/EgtB/PvdO family nonheme iron enzyme [Gemmatimonadetes bacterium]|nr:SUMF1/EgtB/PvdO family nonheme iron enzyme [Gemmatimonadota bacterium]
MIGEAVSHYRVTEKLGGGGMGVVYRAEDTRLGRDVALKFLPADPTGDPEARERFKLEARAASALDHANICTIHDIDETEDGRLFIAMAFYEGETLKARLERGAVGVGEAIEIARQVAAGLARAHEEGIVHRDIKPANLMITGRGDVRILDFGVAKLAGEAGLTRTGAVIGTLGYMSPEQIEGKGVGPAADLWALGVVLYEMVTGAIPFRGVRQTEIAASILTGEPEPLQSDRADLPDGLEPLVLDLLRKDPEQRPPSAGAVAERLAAIAAPVSGPSTPLLRRPATWVGAATVVALLGAAIWWPARSRARLDAARASLAEIESLAGQRRFSEAYALAVSAERALGDDSVLARLMIEVSDVISVRSDPPGATVDLWSFEDGPGASGADELGTIGPMTRLGTTPLVDVRLARGDHYLTLTAEGYAPVERVVSSRLPRTDVAVGLGSRAVAVEVALLPLDSLPEEMVHVPPGAYTLVSADAPAGATIELDEFFIDRFEVTNAEYLEFVRGGGYSDRSYWPDSITPGDGVLRDRTDLPGPRTWTGGQHPPGEDRHPVTSVTWFEASAYCAWRGKALPTLFEWEKAARGGAFTHNVGFVLPWGLVEPGQSTAHRANFGGAGADPVDAYPLGISPFGVYGMAGNVREWTSTSAEEGYVAMGGSWEDPPHVFSSIATPEPWVAAPGLGLRCVRRTATAEAHGAGRIELARRTPSYEPVGRAEYESYLTHYRYDPTGAPAVELEAVETEDWRRVKVRLEGVEGDSILGYLYLPRGASPPYQTMVLVPNTSAFFVDRVDEQLEWLLGANIRSGRAAFAPVLHGMVERQWPSGTTFPASNTVDFRNLMVRHATELSISLDYLESRDDIDMDRLTYIGVSWGAGSRAVLAAIDDRWDAVVFIGAGIDERLHPVVPEALNVNFIPYISVPKLVLNGRRDEEHPWLTRAAPFWELLSEPKELELLDTEGHVPSLETRVPAINDFLDRRLGPTNDASR